MILFDFKQMVEFKNAFWFLMRDLIQFRTEEVSRIKAMTICERLGIVLQTYMRMFISRLIQENSIPFSFKESGGAWGRVPGMTLRETF